jgi:4'-phosphopantetheinyl transferase
MHCTVWVTRASPLSEPMTALLTAGERNRLAGTRFEGDRNRSARGAVLMRLAAADALGVDPAVIVLETTCSRCGGPHGKPGVRGWPTHLSLAHSADLVVVACTPVAAVGVDVERISRIDVAATAPLVLGHGEQLTADDDFFRYWCRKEAVCKATGDGLGVPLDEVVVTPANRPARLRSYRGRGLACHLRDIDLTSSGLCGPTERYEAAVAVLADVPVELRIRDAEELFARLGRFGGPSAGRCSVATR